MENFIFCAVCNLLNCDAINITQCSPLKVQIYNNKNKIQIKEEK